MKRLITLFICAGSIGSVMAQTSAEESRDIILGKRTGPGSTQSDPRSRDVILGRRDDGRNHEDRSRRAYPGNNVEAQRDAVNREYDRKIASIRTNRELSSSEKERTIRQLNKDRAQRLASINRRDNDRRYVDRRDRKPNDKNHKMARKSKSNNGNHYGWKKGKGAGKKKGHYSKRNDD